MIVNFGKIDFFEEGKEIWEYYCECLGYYFIVNGIGDIEEVDKKKRWFILFSVCGSKIYKLMSDLLVLNKLGMKIFDEFVKLV